MTSASTANRISGDTPLSLPRHLRWTLSNLLEQWRDTVPDKRPSFAPPSTTWPSFTTAKPSPPRLWCDLFWSHCAPAVDRLLDAPPDVLDVGCGRGDYARAFLQCFPHLTRYRGVDAFDFAEWRSAADRRLSFAQRRAEDLGPADLDGCNLVVSTSALEHVQNDLEMFARISEQTRGRRLLQLHLIPGAELWRNTGPHGFRGYSARAISKIAALFPDDETCVAALGGSASRHVHRNWVFDRLRPLPRSVQDRRADPAYARTLTAAVQADLAAPAPGKAVFLALVIARRCARPVADAFGPLLR